MRTAIRIRRDVEKAVMRVLDGQVAAGATTRAQSLDYVHRLRAVAAALRAEADASRAQSARRLDCNMVDQDWEWANSATVERTALK